VTEVILQVKCLTNDEGHVWIRNYDELPPAVRQRLRESPYNLCAACLEAFVLPEVHRRHPGYTRLKALLSAIELMEAEVRKEQMSAAMTPTKSRLRGGGK
jgi:hypothetical protein